MNLIQGDSKEVLKTLADNSVDSIVTDPPYELGFMGKAWDNSGIAYDVELWAECLRVLKPGGHLLAFSGTRTYHRMAVAIEDAGFEIRDMIEWVYGSGFPKSLNVGKAVDKLQGNEREEYTEEHWGRKNRSYHNAPDSDMHFKYENTDNKLDGSAVKRSKGTSPYEGWGTALKPAHESICMARKPLSEKTVAANVLKWGTGGINVDGSRVESVIEDKRLTNGKEYDSAKKERNTAFGQINSSKFCGSELGRFPANLILSYAENEYLCKDNLSKDQKDKLYKWLNENT